jgi:hypothetical protein
MDHSLLDGGNAYHLSLFYMIDSMRMQDIIYFGLSDAPTYVSRQRWDEGAITL